MAYEVDFTFILSEVGDMESSEQRGMTWGIVVRQFLCYVISMSLNCLSYHMLVPVWDFACLSLEPLDTAIETETQSG